MGEYRRQAGVTGLAISHLALWLRHPARSQLRLSRSLCMKRVFGVLCVRAAVFLLQTSVTSCLTQAAGKGRDCSRSRSWMAPGKDLGLATF